MAFQSFYRIACALKSKWRLSDPVILVLGAALGLALGLILLRNFIFIPGLPSWQDLIWPYSSHVYPMHYLWDEFRQAPVMPNHMLGYWFFYQFPSETSIRLLYLFLFSMMGMSMFYAAFKFVVPRHNSARLPLVVAVIATVAFIVNPVILRNWTIWYFLWFYAFTPLLVYLMYTAFTRINNGDSIKWLDIIKKSVVIALILFIMSPGERMPYYFCFFPLAFVAGISRPYFQYLKRSVVLLILTLGLYIALSCIWLVPFMNGAFEPSEFYTFSRSILHQFSGDSNLYLSFNLMGISNTYESGIFRVSETLEHFRDAALLMLPIFAFAALLFRRSKLIICLAVFACIFIFLAKGTNPPLGGIYEWIACDSPGISNFGMSMRRPLYWLMPLMICYAFLFCFTLSYSLGWVRDRLKWSVVKKIAFIVIIPVFLATPLLTAIPLLTGDINGAFKPVRVGEHYISMNRWLEEHDEDFKIMYYPRSDPFWFGSGKPTFPLGSRLEGSHMTMWYGLVRDSLPDTIRFGELVSPYNTRYVIFSPYHVNEKYRPELSAAFEEQEDLVLVEEFDSIQVYESEANRSQIGVSTGSIAVQGGLENILSLNAVDSHDMLTQPMIFLDQVVSSSDCLSGVDMIISDQSNLDLYMTMLDEKYMIKLLEAIDDDSQTTWFKSRARPIAGAEWHWHINSAGLINWQSDFDFGFARSHRDSLNMSFSVNHAGDYDILIRCLKSIAGGGFRVILDGELVDEFFTGSQVDEFEWVNVGTFSLESGKHKLTLDHHTSGLNAVNIVAVLPVGEIERYESQMDELVSDKRLMSVWEAETALNQSGASVSEKYGCEASNGEILELAPGSSAWRDFEVARDGRYRIAVSMSGDATVKIDDMHISMTSAVLDFTYSAPIDLGKGGHSLEIVPASGQVDLDVIWLYTVEYDNETVEDIFDSTGDSAELIDFTKVNPTKYKASVRAEEPFILSFAESYEKTWVARVNGQEYSSIPLNGVVNGFYIQDTGELEITIEYKPQKWLYYGTVITAISIIGVIVYFIWDWRRRRRSS